MLDRCEEAGGEVGLAVDRVGRGDRGPERVLGDPGDAGACEFRGAEQEIAVAALEAALLAHKQPGLGQGGAGGKRGEVEQAVGERARVGAAADALAMGVEQDDFEVAEPVPGHGVDEPEF